jgi:hypothetical protein
MKVAHAVLMSVAALLIGVIAGYVAAPGAAPRLAATAPAELVDEQIPAQPKSPARSEPSAAALRESEIVPGPIRQSESLAVWLKTFADDVPKAGDGRIFGRVTLPDGNGLRGVTLTLSPQFPGAFPSYNDANLEAQLEKYARRAHFYRRGTRTAVTDQDGRYEFLNLGDYNFDMRATAPAYDVRMASGIRYPVQIDAEVNWVANPISQVEFDIRLEDGSRPDEVRLIFQYTDGRSRRERRYTWTPGAPLIKAEAGRCTVSATAGEFENFKSEGLEITLRDGATPGRHEIILRAVPGIVCLVHMPPELQGRVSPRIHLFGDPQDDPPGRALDNPGLTTTLGTRGNRHQSTFQSLNPGRYRLVVTCFEVVLAWRDVDLGRGLEVVTLDVRPLNPADFIVARVYSPAGELLPDAQIRAMQSGRDVPHGPRQFTLPRGDGTFWLLRRVPADHESSATGTWEYNVSAQDTDHGVYNVRYPANATHELEIRFPHPATLTITLPGASAHPLKDRLLPHLARKSESGGWAGVGNEQGLKDTLEYGPLLPGSYRFRLMIAEAGGDSLRSLMRGVTVAEWDFELAAGANARTFTIPALHTLTLIVPETRAAGHVELRHAEGQGNRTISGDRLTERTEIVGLVAGEWVLRTRQGEMTIRINGDTEATLAVRPYNCLRLGIKAGGGIEALGLRDGDLLIGVDGQEFESLEILLAQLRGTYGKDVTTWTVLRDGVPTNVMFSGKALLRLDTAQGDQHERLSAQPALRD